MVAEQVAAAALASRYLPKALLRTAERQSSCSNKQDICRFSVTLVLEVPTAKSGEVKHGSSQLCSASIVRSVEQFKCSPGQKPGQFQQWDTATADPRRYFRRLCR